MLSIWFLILTHWGFGENGAQNCTLYWSVFGLVQIVSLLLLCLPSSRTLLCHLHSVNAASELGFFVSCFCFCVALGYYIFQSYGFHFFLRCSVSLLRLPVFAFALRKFALPYWDIFITAVFKSLSDNSNILCHLGLGIF